jgi:hypothetical protein
MIGKCICRVVIIQIYSAHQKLGEKEKKEWLNGVVA